MSATAILASRKSIGLLRKRAIHDSIKEVIPNPLYIDIVPACSSTVGGGSDSF